MGTLNTAEFEQLVSTFKQVLNTKLKPNADILERFAQLNEVINLPSGELLRTLKKFEDDNQAAVDALIASLAQTNLLGQTVISSSLITTQGQAVIDAADLANKISVSRVVVGDGNGAIVTPEPSMVSLVNEIYSGLASNPIIDPNNPTNLYFDILLPLSLQGTIREVGLITDDNKLLSVGAVVPAEKNNGESLLVRVVLTLQDVGEVDLFQFQNPLLSHGALNGREAEDSHPISAITGLNDSLASALEKALGVNARVYPRLTNQNLKVGDVIPAPEDTADGLPITHVIVDGNAYAMSPVVSGLVAALTTSSATIGGTIVNLNHLGAFDSVHDISGTTHTVGSTIRTLGFYQRGDGGHAEYFIDDSGVVDGWSVIQCVSCVAKLIPVNGEINSLQAGIFDDGATDYTLRISEFHAYGKDNCTELQYLRSTNGTGVIRSRLFRTERVVVKGNNAKPITISLFWQSGDSQVMVQARPFSLVSGLDFSSEMEDLELQRAGFENTADVLFDWCNFRGFRHVSAKPNAWGAYISGSRRIYLVDCGFENNSQSDFAVVDGNTDIQIIRPRRLGSELVANIEPNGSNGNDRIKISGGVYTKVYLLVNSRNSNPAKSVIVEECSIDELVYDGADVTFDRVDIATIRPETSTEIYMGSLDFTNCGVAFGANLVKDHRLSIVGNNPACNWQFVYNSGPIAQMCRLLSTQNYRGVTINPDALNQQYIIANSDPILVTEQDTYLVGITGFVNTLNGGFYGNYGRIRFTDSLNNEVSRIDLRPFRTSDNTNSAIRTEYAFVNAPMGATRAYIDLRNGEAATTNKLNVLSVTMHRVYIGRGSFAGVQNDHAIKAGKTTIENSKSYKGDEQYRIGMITGDEVMVGANKYVCTDASVFNGPHFVGAWAQYSATSA